MQYAGIVDFNSVREAFEKKSLHEEAENVTKMSIRRTNRVIKADCSREYKKFPPERIYARQLIQLQKLSISYWKAVEIVPLSPLSFSIPVIFLLPSLPLIQHT